MTDTVTRIDPAPSIPNPLVTNPWVELSDTEIEDGIFAAKARIDAAEHTVASLTRERQRRVREAKCGAWYHGQPGCSCAELAAEEQAPVPEVQHERYDPLCSEYRAPRGPDSQYLQDFNRGRSCPICVSQAPVPEVRPSDEREEQ